jgi:hypothetical protein
MSGIKQSAKNKAQSSVLSTKALTRLKPLLHTFVTRYLLSRVNGDKRLSVIVKRRGSADRE